MSTKSKLNNTDGDVSASSNRKQDNSDWMKNLSSIIRDTKPITDISIPGSHDSITYSLKKYGPAYVLSPKPQVTPVLSPIQDSPVCLRRPLSKSLSNSEWSGW